ncbi:aldo/keto reductase [Paenibacillus nasutitermitis]|uniref:aldo/keto reductase n=1 Tax=Paenibacillus nasutitermitis TaxID=1652958 RepID=UPI0027E418DE|nr:aldo/keto reductase [Paenibacillus nasutitermitis]
MQNMSDRARLHNGVEMPWLGLGVYQMDEDKQVVEAVQSALSLGYRSIDTATLYQNETGVGEAVASSGIAREEIFITTKVWNSDQGYESTLAAFETSRRKLGLDYIDLYLIHWPVKGKYKDTWRALEKLYAEGAVRAIGVSNFQPSHIEDIMADSQVIPMVNQVEYHPKLAQKPLLAFCQFHGIQLEAWSPLMNGKLDDPLLHQIAAQYGKTAAQVVLRWDLQNGVVTIPKTVHPGRMKENMDLFDFELSPQDMALISQLDQSVRLGADPDNFDF